jgi:hypothetical protein
MFKAMLGVMVPGFNAGTPGIAGAPLTVPVTQEAFEAGVEEGRRQQTEGFNRRPD